MIKIYSTSDESSLTVRAIAKDNNDLFGVKRHIQY
jgi:hypothetical protein